MCDQSVTDSYETLTRVRVLLVDNHPAIRKCLRIALSGHPKIELISEAESGEEALERFTAICPDVVVMDIRLPGGSGLETTKLLCMHNSNARILIFSVYDGKPYVSLALKAGALGYVCKSSLPQVLFDGIMNVARGKEFLDPAISSIYR